MTTNTNPEGGWWVAALVLRASPQTLGLGVGGRCRLDLTYTLKSQSRKRRGTRWRGGGGYGSSWRESARAGRRPHILPNFYEGPRGGIT